MKSRYALRPAPSLRVGKEKYRVSEIFTAFCFLLPAFVIFTVFRYLPLLNNFYTSLTSWNFFNPKRFVGLANFQNILADKIFWKVLGNTFFYTLWSTGLSLGMGLVLALLLFRYNSFAARSLKTLYFIPNITTASAVALLWMWIFDPDNGLSGQIFNLFGATSPRWLMDNRYAMWVIISLTVWRNMGYVMTIYFSGLSGISDDIYEAARIDGASQLQQSVFITIPLLVPTTLFLLTTTFISSMQVFDVVQVMTGGGPANNTNVLNLMIYQEAFVRGRAGKAAALSVILFILLLLCTVIQRKITGSRGDQNV